MIQRIDHLRRLATLLREFPVVGLLGPRQVGKTTLARTLARGRRPQPAPLLLAPPRSD